MNISYRDRRKGSRLSITWVVSSSIQDPNRLSWFVVFLYYWSEFGDSFTLHSW